MGVTLSRAPLTQWLRDVFDLSLATLLGAECAVCGTALITGAICEACARLSPLEPPFCRCCGYPLVESLAECGECLAGDPSEVDEVRSVYWFDENARKLWAQIKFHQRNELLPRIRLPMLSEASLVVPIPISFSRFTQRWMNHAEWLADQMAPGKRKDLLVKAVDADPQSLMKKSLRKKNVRGAFEVRGEVPAEILLIDDIYTTGATASECARVLKNAGARVVRMLSLFRTPRLKLG